MDVQGLGGSVRGGALDVEGGRLTGLILQVTEQGRYGVELNAVDAEDLVVRLEAGSCSGHAGLERVDLDGGVLHLWDEADLVEGEVVRAAALGFDEEFGVGALAVVDEGEWDGLVEIQDGAVGDVFPGGIFDGVVVDDAVAGVDAGFGGGSLGLEVVGDGGAVEELLHLVVERGDGGHEAEGEDEVGDGAGEGDEDALPAGMGVEVAGVGGGDGAGAELVAGKAHLAGHLDVAAEGDGGDLIFGLAAAEAEEAFAEADGEDLDADAAEFGDGEVAELVYENHDAEDDEKLDDCGHEVGEDLVTFWVFATFVRRWTDGQSLRAQIHARQDLLRALRG